MRKFNFIIITAIIFAVIMPTKADAANFKPDFETYSQSVYLYNLNSKQIVYSKNPDEHLQPASLTKIMTAILAFEHFKDNPDAMKTTKVTFPSDVIYDVNQGGAQIADIRFGESPTYENLINALLVYSGCDAANIIAYDIGGGNIQKFVDMMNEKAKKLGCKNTNFKNAHGLYDPEQYTTASDIAKMLEYVYETFPQYKEITTTTVYYMPALEKHAASYPLPNTNNMIQSWSEHKYKYITSGKTGTLKKDDSGSPELRNLATTASKDNVDYLLVTMGSPVFDSNGQQVMYTMLDQKKLYNWAFDNLEYKIVFSKNTELNEVPVAYGKKQSHLILMSDDDIKMFWPKELDSKNIEVDCKFNSTIIAPVTKGQKMGKADLKIGGETFATIDVFAGSSIKRDNIAYYISLAKQFPSSKLFRYALLVCGVILVVYIAILASRYVKVTKKKINKKSKKIKRRKF